MNKKVLHVLEYDKIMERLTEKATSDQGRKLTSSLVPMTDLEAINQAQTETADALGYLFRKGSTSFGGNKDLGMCIKSLEIGSVLSIPELLRIAAFLENVSRIKSYGRKEREDVPADSLDVYFESLEPLTLLSNEIRRCILSEEEIADDASPNLKRIRRSMTITNDRIHSHLASMINGSCRTYLQDAVITMRNNRYCIPVKSEYKGQVQGMVHDQSSTGSTFFIEPAAVVSLNNELRELELEEQKEIAVILAGLSAQTGAYTEVLTKNQQAMTSLDFIFAKASLAMEQNATMPIFNTDHQIQIRQGRHPLLDKKKVVPIDKLSVVITLLLAFVFLHEQFTIKSIVGCILIGVGTLFMVL
jgi:DNA mismatch repair protein MutS2